ncbi:MAG: ketopantoate reductase family protein [Lachnospiraceae bacterium]|nr:ketopantoate reductase family protein [Lachnospiraceae bacterium]
MKIQTAALMGAGAIGAYFILLMTESMGERFCLVASGERKKKLERNGVMINGKRFLPPVRTPKEAAGCDLLLIATKYGGLLEALDDIETVVKENTVVMSLLNGIDSEEIIAERVGAEHMVYSFMRIISARKSDGIFFNPDITKGVIFGEKEGNKDTERIRALRTLFDETGVHYKVHDNVIRGMWEKYAINICYNLPQAVLNLNFISYFRGEHVAFIRDRLYDEVASVGKAEGVDVPEIYKDQGNAPGSARFSTLQDLDAKRPTEVDMFLGTLIRLAKKHGIAVPFAEYTYHGIKAREDQNAGVYDL